MNQVPVVVILNDGFIGKSLNFVFSDITGGNLLQLLDGRDFVGIAFVKKTPFFGMAGKGDWSAPKAI